MDSNDRRRYASHMRDFLLFAIMCGLAALGLREGHLILPWWIRCVLGFYALILAVPFVLRVAVYLGRSRKLPRGLRKVIAHKRIQPFAKLQWDWLAFLLSPAPAYAAGWGMPWVVLAGVPAVLVIWLLLVLWCIVRPNGDSWIRRAVDTVDENGWSVVYLVFLLGTTLLLIDLTNRVNSGFAQHSAWWCYFHVLINVFWGVMALGLILLLSMVIRSTKGLSPNESEGESLKQPVYKWLHSFWRRITFEGTRETLRELLVAAILIQGTAGIGLVTVVASVQQLNTIVHWWILTPLILHCVAMLCEFLLLFHLQSPMLIIKHDFHPEREVLRSKWIDAIFTVAVTAFLFLIPSLLFAFWSH